jgi:hypothetical protein
MSDLPINTGYTYDEQRTHRAVLKDMELRLESMKEASEDAIVKAKLSAAIVFLEAVENILTGLAQYLRQKIARMN